MTQHQRSKKRVGLASLAAIGVVASLASVNTSASAAQTAVAPQAAAAKTPNTARLAGTLAKQKLTWEKCDYQDPKLNERFGSLDNVQCATVMVPRDWHNPDPTDTIGIRISQAKNIDVKNARYKGTIFVNPGGPGGSGLPWAAAMTTRAFDLVPYYNFVGFDPRGVGQSAVPACDVTYDENSTDPYVLEKAVASACNKHKYSSVISTEQTAYDMDFIRGLLKAPKLSYIGYSYGTWLGAWYENIFGANSDKFLLDSATDVTQPTLQRTWDLQPIARDRQFEKHLMNWIARHNDIYKLGTDPKQVYDRYFEGASNMNSFMLQMFWGFGGGFAAFPDNSKYPDAAAVVATVSEWAESPVAKRRAADVSPAAQADALLASLASSPHASADLKARVKEGRADLAPLTKLKARSNPPTEQPLTAPKAARSADEPTDDLPENLVTEQFSEPFELIRCNDGQWTQGAAYWEAFGKKQSKKAPFSAQFGLTAGVPLCAFWRTNTMMPVANPASFPNTVVLQGELDSQTAYETGFATGTKLPNTKLTLIDNEGSHGHFPYGTECVDRRVYDFFLTGKLAGKDVKLCQGIPLPQESTTFESWTKLKANGKPGSPVSGATIPTKADARSAKLSGAPLEIVDPQVRAQTERVIRQAYGQAGVDEARKSGLID